MNHYSTVSSSANDNLTSRCFFPAKEYLNKSTREVERGGGSIETRLILTNVYGNGPCVSIVSPCNDRCPCIFKSITRSEHDQCHCLTRRTRILYSLPAAPSFFRPQNRQSMFRDRSKVGNPISRYFRIFRRFSGVFSLLAREI